MKNLTFGIAVLSLAGVITIFIMSHTSHVNPSKEDIKIEKNDSNFVNVVPSNIAYIDVQRITNEYGFYQDIVKNLEEKQKRAEAEYGKKAQAFQQEYEAYMKKAQMGAFLSQESQQQQEMELRSKQENLAMLEQDLSMKLQSDMQKLDAQATDTIMSYLKKFNISAKYDLILNSATILDPGQTTNVTDSILSILNQKYQEHKASTTKK